MRLRLIVSLLGFALVGAAVVALAQPPVAPVQPSIPQIALPPSLTVPQAAPLATGQSPSAAARLGDCPLSRFEPLAAFPANTQAAVRGVLLAANWLTRMNQSHGRFMYGMNPALKQPLASDRDLLQARAALAVSQLASFTGDEKQAAIASQAILTLLATTKLDPADASCRVPIHSSLLCNRVGFASTLALAIYALPKADPRLLGEAERLCEFLRKQCRPDGSIHYTDGTTEISAEVDPAGANEYPGLALQAIAVGNRFRPSPWKMEALKKGIAYYRSYFQTKPNMLLAATLTPGCAEAYFQTKWADAAAATFEANDWLCRYQIGNSDPRIPQWNGGFRAIADDRPTDVPSGPETGFYLQSLAYASHVAAACADGDRRGKFKTAATDAAQYLTEQQYVEANTRHFESAFRVNMLIGAFHLSPTDGNIRIDATAVAASGLLRFLELVAERD